jgi:hypothetical protein
MLQSVLANAARATVVCGWLACSSRAPGAAWWLGLAMGAAVAASVIGFVEASTGRPTPAPHCRDLRDTWLRRQLRNALSPVPRSRGYVLLASLLFLAALHDIPIATAGAWRQPFIVASMASSLLVWGAYALRFPTRRPAR